MDSITGKIAQNTTSITATATPIPATMLAGRRTILIRNKGSQTVYLGDEDVTTTDGYPLDAGDEIGLDIGDSGESNDLKIYGIVANDTCEVRSLEGA